MRNKGVREYWEASGRNLFAQDFVNEVDIILKDATNERSPASIAQLSKFDIQMYELEFLYGNPYLHKLIDKFLKKIWISLVPRWKEALL